MKAIKILKLGLRIVPIVGRIVKNKESKEGGKGRIVWRELIEDVIEIAGAVGLSQLF